MLQNRVCMGTYRVVQTLDRGFAQCGMYPCMHDFAPPLGFFSVWRSIEKNFFLNAKNLIYLLHKKK